MSNEVHNRRDMADRLESVMTKSYGDLKEELSLERNHSLVKSYLIEAHTSQNSSHDDRLRLIRESFAEPRGRRKIVDVSVKATKDEALFIINGTYGRGQFVFFVDTSDHRFWIAHSISRSEASDSAIDIALSNNPHLDYTWMPMELLEAILRSGLSRGLALDFDRRYLDSPAPSSKRKNVIRPVDEPARESEKNPIHSEKHLEYVKMQLWGAGADRILRALKDADLAQSTTISKVRLKNFDSIDQDQFSLADVKYDGKVTGRGTSFAMYNGLLVNVLGRYASAVRSAEATFRLHWEAESGRGIPYGQPFFVKLGTDGVRNLEHFCAKVFSGSEPFRLLGVPVRRNANFYTVSAVDLHVNQRIDFEVSRKTLSVFLPKRACGNTLLRLYTNLQHYFSSDVSAIDGSGSDVFSF